MSQWERVEWAWHAAIPGQLQKLYVLSIEEVEWYRRDAKTGHLAPAFVRAPENNRRNVSAREVYKKLILDHGAQPQLRVLASAQGCQGRWGDAFQLVFCRGQ